MVKSIMKNDKKYKVDRRIIGGILLIVFLCIIMFLIDKAQLSEQWEKSVKATLMSEHKKNSQIRLNDLSPEFSETFLITVPDLKSLTVECVAKNISNNAKIVVQLKDDESNKEIINKQFRVNKIFKNGTRKKFSLEIKDYLKNQKLDSKNKYYTLSWQLVNPEKTELIITSNIKQGIVDKFNGEYEDKTNVIYSIEYSNCAELKSLYVIFCILLLLFAIVCYYLLIVKKKNIQNVFVPIALFLGMIFNFVIMIHGVPDEPWHIDTAYKYSNKIMFIEDTNIPGTIYKRECDVKMEDMLANGVESNSYYQLKNHLFEIPEDQKLQKVSYIDTSNLMPFFVYLPTALGISIGRILGLSSIFTLLLGRLLNLLFFILVVECAIRIIPYGKNVFAMIAMLPIAMQQAASASYDTFINAVILLFIALCYKLTNDEEKRKRDIIVLVILVFLIATLKAGVYLPISLLLFSLYKQNKRKKITVRRIVISIGIISVIIVILSIILMKYYPTISGLLGTMTDYDPNINYTLGYLLQHPAKIVYLYWNTFIQKGDLYLRGALGGVLAWHDIRINWIYMFILLIGLLFLVNVEEDSYRESNKKKILLCVSGISPMLLIMLSMLFACTKMSSSSIQAVQGRYFLPLMPLLLFASRNSMIKVQKFQTNIIIFVMLMIEILILLQFVTLL